MDHTDNMQFNFVSEILISVFNDEIELSILDDGKNNIIIKEINEKLKIYSDLYKEGNERISNISNNKYKNLESKYKNLDKKIRNEYEIEIEILNNKIKNIQNKFENEYKDKLDFELNKNNSKLDIEKNKIKMLEDTITNIKSHELILYNSKLDIEKNKIKMLEDTITNIKSHELILYNSKLDIEKNKIKMLNIEIENLKKDKIEFQQNVIQELTKKISVQTTGRLGEINVYDYIFDNIIKANPEDYKLEDVSKDQKHSSDLKIKYKKLNAVIEIKNIEGKIYENDIKKFENEYIINNNYNCGIFISLKSDYGNKTNIYDFKIKIINNKPIIYLSYAGTELNKIIFAIQILNHLIETKRDDNKYNEVWELVKMQVNNYSENIKDLFAVNKIINNLISKSKKQKIEIEQFLNNEESEKIETKINNNADNVAGNNTDNVAGNNTDNVANNPAKIDKTLININKHCRMLDNNDIYSISCNYCKAKPYANNSRGITHFKNHLVNKHNI